LLNSTGSKVPRNTLPEYPLDLERAIEYAEILWFDTKSFSSTTGPTIAQVAHEWIEERRGRVKGGSLAQTSVEDDDLPRLKYFLTWCSPNGFNFWTELLPRNIQVFADEGAENFAASYIKKRVRVVRQLNEYVARNYPDFYRPLPFQMPRGKDYGDKPTRPAFSFDQMASFLAHSHGKAHGWDVLAGYALCGPASLRLREMRRALWEHYDAQNGNLTVLKAKGGLYRVIPVCDLVRAILEEAFEQQNPKPTDPIVSIQDPGRFRQRFYRYLKTWCKATGNWDFWMSPYGLRRTLPREFLQRGLYGITLQLYRGHKSEQVSQVDWQFYLDRMEADPAGIYSMFQKEVVEPLNSILNAYQTPWSGSEGKVIQLFG
jgi:integrase